MSIKILTEREAWASKNYMGGARFSLREMRGILAEFEAERQRADELSEQKANWVGQANSLNVRVSNLKAELALLQGTQEPVTMDALRDAVVEMTGGLPMEWRETTSKGHHRVPFINFNSLHRIVSKFTCQPKPVVNLNHIGRITAQISGQRYTYFSAEDIRHCFEEMKCVIVERTAPISDTVYAPQSANDKPVVPVGFLFVVKATGAIIYSISDAAIEGTQLIGKIYGDTAIEASGFVVKDGE